MGLRKQEELLTKVIRRTSLPPQADSYVHESNVLIHHKLNILVEVTTFCGVKILCTITERRDTKTGPIYTVKPEQNLWQEFKKAGVPVDDRTAMLPFTAFDWQISKRSNN